MMMMKYLYDTFLNLHYMNIHKRLSCCCFFSDDESKLLDEITGGMATSRMKSRDPFSGGLPHPPQNALRTSQGFGIGSKTGGWYFLLVVHMHVHV